MKIAFFTDSFLPSADGVATSVAMCAKELRHRGHKVYIIAPNQPHKHDSKNVHRLVSLKLLKTPEIWFALEVPSPSLFKIAALDADIAHGHSGGPVSFMGWQFAKYRNIPFVETYHTLWKYYGHYFMLPKFLSTGMINKTTGFIGNKCDAIIAPSVKAKRDLLNDGIKKPVYIVPNGIYHEKFRISDTGFLRRKLKIDKDCKIILTVGRLEKEKSIDFIIKSFALIKKKLSMVNLVIIGEGRDKIKLKKLALALGIGDHVYFAGRLDYEDMPKAYAGADLFAFASKTESQGMAVIEALASGLPAVVVKDSVFEGVIVEGENGFFTQRNSHEFALKVSNLLKEEAALKKMSLHARASGAKFSVHETGSKLESVYLEILHKKRNESHSHAKAG